MRQSLDKELGTLLQDAERKYFSSDPVKQILIPDELFHCGNQCSLIFKDATLNGRVMIDCRQGPATNNCDNKTKALLSFERSL